jgi:hypothetical protein
MDVDAENRRLRAAVNDLHHRLMSHVQKHGREDRLCEHVTMRAPHLPCPHLECYPSGATTLYVERLHPLSFAYAMTPEEYVGPERERWDRARLVLEGSEFWAWRRHGEDK